MRSTPVLVAAFTALAAGATLATVPSQAPDVPRVDAVRLARIDDVVGNAIADGQLPGAVVVVWHRGRTIYSRALGHRALVPAREVMTLDTVFDLASLTKVVATTTSVMALVEDGHLRLTDPVARHLPGFERHGKDAVSVEQLLTHVSGLRPDLPLEDAFTGHETAIARVLDERLVATPGTTFIYSDLNFVLLGEIVSRVSGVSLDAFARQRVFEPLGMHDTMFSPPAALRPRIAPTEACTPLGWPCGGPGAVMLRGTVHDPTARRMGGVAGHAGLFGTAADLTRFAAMLLSGGRLSAETPRILAPLTVARMTTPATPPGVGDRRGLGWDIDSRFSANRGDLFSARSFGHTGFTGPSMWIDPLADAFVIFLANRVHPAGEGNVTALRGRVATLAAAALLDIPLDAVRVAGNDPGVVGVRGTGVDVLRAERFARLRGRRVGLVTNQTGRARDGRSTIDLLHDAPEVELRALFSPEHGIRGDRDGAVDDSRDEATGLPIHSLYGATRRPTAQMLDGLDTLVVDLQDAGARFYTYATTMAYVMEEAARHGLSIVVLDRPNPINGVGVEGPLLDDDPSTRGFTGYFPMPIRHGLTIGELARLFNGERGIGADLEVVAVEGWSRPHWFDETGLTWINPSPNLRSLNQATLYPGLGAIEGTNVSVGRGTDTPFEQLGAPWMNGVGLAAALNARLIPGLRVYPVRFTPESSRYAGQVCHGVFLRVTDRARFRPVRAGVEIAAALARLHPVEFEIDATVRLLGSHDVVRRIRAGDDPAEIAASWAAGEEEWRALRERYLLYR